MYLLVCRQFYLINRYVVLDDLAAVSGSLRQWEIEKDLQANFAAEVRKLREQLREAEERLKKQKERAASMGAKVAAVHEKMNFGRKECYRIAKICTGLGTQIFGRKYKYDQFAYFLSFQFRNCVELLYIFFFSEFLRLGFNW